MAAWRNIDPEPSPTPGRRKHLFLSHLDDPDYERAVDAADQAVVEKELALYPLPLDQRVGWTKDAA